MKFRYDPGTWPPALFQVRMLFWILFSNALCIWLLVYYFIPDLITTGIQDQEGWKALLYVLLFMFLIVRGNMGAFSRLLLRSDLEHTRGQLILHPFPLWDISISMSDLNNESIQQQTIPQFRLFGTGLGVKMEVYFISSPGLPWYFQFVGMFVNRSFRGRGFFITSRHTDYEMFLDQMKSYEGV